MIYKGVSMYIVLIFGLLLALAYVFSLIGRTHHKGLANLRGWAYAHRGLHGNGVPENSMAAFRLAKEAGYGIEFDLHLLSDGNLAVIHDAKLDRTTGCSGNIEDLTTEDLCKYRLEGTEETIPQFQQVLDLFAGEAPLIVELKCENNNYAALCETACKMLDSYTGPYCMESFDPRCIHWLRKNRPDIIRGQLSYDYIKKHSKKHPVYLQFLLAYNMLNFLTKPDFIAYHFETRKTLSNWICRKIWGIQGVSWTIRSQKDFDIAVKEGWLPIFENFRP